MISSGDSGGSGRTYRSFWRTRLLYTLTFEARTTRVVVPTVIEIESRGELNGAGRWSLAEEGSATRVRYDWNVSTTKTWMNWLAPVLRPLFAWNHDAVMKDGAAGLAKLLNAQVETLKEQD